MENFPCASNGNARSDILAVLCTRFLDVRNVASVCFLCHPPKSQVHVSMLVVYKYIVNVFYR